jgi:hypothetical protein
MKKFKKMLGGFAVIVLVFGVVGTSGGDDDNALIQEIVTELDSSGLPTDPEEIGFKGLEDSIEGADEMGFGSPFSFSEAVSKAISALQSMLGMSVDDKLDEIKNSTDVDSPGISKVYEMAKDAIDNNFFVSVFSASGVSESGGVSSVSLGSNWGSLDFVGAESTLDALGYFWVAFCGLVGMLDFLRG